MPNKRKHHGPYKTYEPIEINITTNRNYNKNTEIYKR